MPNPKKKPIEMTDAETIKEIFPKEIREVVKKIAGSAKGKGRVTKPK